MTKAPLLPLTVLILAAPARAAVVEAAPGGAAWVAPVAGVFAAVGSQRIAAIGLPSLTALSAVGESARYPFAGRPQVLDLLAANLRYYATPESFAALPADDKLYALTAAAKGAEIEAAAFADKALAEAARPLHPGTMERVGDELERAFAVLPYLDAGRRERVSAARRRVAKFKIEWRARVDRFSVELPLKIANGAFDASNLVVKTEHGWIAADESLVPIDETKLGIGESPDWNEGELSQFFLRRVDALRKAPQGPWIAAEAELLRGNFDRLAAEGVPSVRAVYNSFRLQIAPLAAPAAPSLPLARAAAAFEKNARDGSPVAVRHVLAVEEAYARLQDSGPAARSIRLRMLAAMRDGMGGLPSWERWREIEREVSARTRRNALRSTIALIASTILLAVVGMGLSPAWPAAARFAALASLWLPAMIAYVRYLTLGSRLDAARSSAIDETLRRTFERDRAAR